MTPSLRRWSLDDADAVLTAFASRDMFEQANERIVDVQGAVAWIEQRLAANPERTRLFAIDVDGIAVGEVALSGIERRHRTGWASYWLTPDARGQGLATRALVTLCELGFGELGLARIELGHRTNNSGSGAVARRAGFQLEGTERERLEYDGLRYDVDRYARLVADPAPQVEPISRR